MALADTPRLSRRALRIALIVALAITPVRSLGQVGQPPADRDTHAAAISVEATAYIDAALTVMQENFLHRDAIDWPALRRETFRQAGAAQLPVDTYPALRFALATLGDHHSYLQLTPPLAQQEAARKPALTDPSAMPAPEARKPSFPFPSPFRTRRVPEGAMVAGVTSPLAQIVVPLFASPNRQELDDFATTIQNVIRTLAAAHPCGWVVDLRGNGGGNIWAMLAGIGPIVGEGVVGGRLDHDLAKTSWFYKDGAAGERTGQLDSPYAKAGRPVMLEGTPPVAVLMDRETGNFGEGIVLAFRGRPETRFFGETTFGAATSTFPYPLSDGAQIYLVTAVMLDRTGREYPTGIAPDEEILSEATISTNDPVLRGASDWLSARPACHRAGH